MIYLVFSLPILYLVSIRYLRYRRMNRMFQDILRHGGKRTRTEYLQPEDSEELEAARAVFGLYGNLSKELIEEKFRVLVKIHHPDKNGDREIFQNILRHRSVLMGEE